jgi:hypothetical protein
MSLKVILTIVAGIISLGAYIPYAVDILKGRAQPARAARIMFVGLLFVTLLQQKALGSGSLIVFTLGEAIGSVAILFLAIKYGVGGLSKLDVACYSLLIIDVVVWLITGSPLVALHLSVLADVIAFTPTLVKTWKRPKTETAIFFVGGILAPVFNIIGTGRYSYSVLLFPCYIAVANLIETLMITIKGKQGLFTKSKQSEPVI